MVHSVFTRPVDLSHLLGYFLDRIEGDDYIPPEGEKCNPHQLELVLNQDDLSIRVLHDEGAWQNVLPPWYRTAEIRRQQGFTSDYFRQISAQAEASAEWKTKDGTPVLTREHPSHIAPVLCFLEVVRESERILFTTLGYVVAEKESLRREPLRLHNGGTVYPR
ncbi:MAG: hypothetical protein Q7R76_03290 [Candidatus Woesearchaeota archaeon]|nr:hypothetical protein [Candidatus Woesearchaeota archaeon]